jgi:hypothetical protein
MHFWDLRLSYRRGPVAQRQVHEAYFGGMDSTFFDVVR